ncbi:MAG: CxxxxCH/CxxCH domain-containing protein [Geobacteraceae bacterium]|nr:CxxxxCH/CxxCH domain-containing protein [Geobacteraceae bacterium]
MKILQFGIVLLCLVALWGCSNGNASAVTIDPATKKHAAGWAVAGTGGSHPDAFFAASASCEECHGKLTDPAGGISKVSCSSNNRSGMVCHAGKFPHGTGFDVPITHGTKKAIAAAGTTSGMAFCSKCHGAAFAGAPESNGVGCISCHQAAGSNAPHASKWASYLGNPKGFNHSATHESNAPVCAQCHAAKSNLSAAGVIRVAVYTSKGVGGCFDNTMCHNQARHALPYTARTDHGVAAAANISSCSSSACHGNGTIPLRLNKQLNGNTNIPEGCETCHKGTQNSVFGGVGLGLAHPYLWLQSRGTTNSHSSASFGSVGEYCSPCHALTGSVNGPSAPSCGTASIIGATRCHSSLSNPVANPTQCVSCHGNPPGSNKHAFHLPPTLPLIGCSECHGVSSGSGQVSHADATVNFGFNNLLFGEATGITYAAGVCSNVSCHGGKPTPSWTTGSVSDPAFLANCLNCHEPVDTVGNAGGQYINVYNGDNIQFGSLGIGVNLHYGHIKGWIPGNDLPCSDCHLMTATHFDELYKGKREFVAGDPQAKGFAASTIRGTRITSYTGATGSCNNNCHGPLDVRNWFQ